MNKKIVSGLAIAAAATLALGVVATSPATAAGKSEVTLAFQGPLTGGDAQLGQDQIPGAIYAIALYNAKNLLRLTHSATEQLLQTSLLVLLLTRQLSALSEHHVLVKHVTHSLHTRQLVSQ
ncbi:MAG: hypothetical protein RL470_1116 [Actinomycetota bacterium]